MKVAITGLGLYLPPKIETAAELSEKIGRSTEWIISRTGVKERRNSEIEVDEMGAMAARDALGNGSPPDFILNASGVGRQAIPDTSVFIQRELGYKSIPSFSIHATCLSFPAAFQTAANFIQNKVYNRVLIVSSDRGTRGRNLEEPESAALLGDGAAAVILEPTPTNEDSELLYWSMKTWPSGAELTELRGGGTRLPPHEPKMKPEDNLFTMQGPKVYKMARKQVYQMIQDMLNDQQLKKDDIDLVIPHQASHSAVMAYTQHGGFPEEKVVNIVGETGNCVAASLPMALAMAEKRGQLQRGNIVLLIGTGAGLSAATLLIRY